MRRRPSQTERILQAHGEAMRETAKMIGQYRPPRPTRRQVFAAAVTDLGIWLGYGVSILAFLYAVTLVVRLAWTGS